MRDNHEITEQLLNDLESIRQDGMLPLERRLMDTAIWFHRNKDRVPREDLPKRLDFMEKTLDIFLEMVALATERLQGVEGRPKSENLWLPGRMSVRGDLKRTGR